MTDKRQISRKDFLKGMGTSLAGVAVAGTLGATLTGCSNTASADEAPEHPFEYKEIDPEKAKKRAYDAYFDQGGWGVGFAEGFFGTLADDVGYPFDQIPPVAFTHAASGYGVQTLCGALGVAATCIGMVTDPDTSSKVIRELYNWYKDFDFPHYQPEDLNLTQTVADSYYVKIQ